ncbi:MAG: outer membrane protein [Hyphomicrobiaceae bacterium]
MVSWKELTLRPVLRLAAAAFLASFLSGTVRAQDHRPWSGFYAGIHGGYNWGAGDSSIALLPDLATWTAFSADFAQFHGRYDSSPEGFLGGAQLGFNWQAGGLVFGVETDMSRLNADGRAERTSLIAALSYTAQAQIRQEIDWLGTLRARIGLLPFEGRNLLVYLTGGLAYGRIEASHSFANVDNGAGFVGSSSGWEVGGTIGGGVEWAMGGAWTLKAEYLYYDLGDRKVHGAHHNNAAPPEFGTDARYELQGHIARIGLNLQLGQP